MKKQNSPKTKPVTSSRSKDEESKIKDKTLDTTQKESITKELINQWKEKWLIKRNSKVWWELMVKESLEAGFILGKQEALKSFAEKIKEEINNYVKNELKLTLKISEEWEKHKDLLGKMYSNQYYAFIELKSFWDKLNKLLKEELKNDKE